MPRHSPDRPAETRRRCRSPWRSVNPSSKSWPARAGRCQAAVDAATGDADNGRGRIDRPRAGTESELAGPLPAVPVIAGAGGAIAAATDAKIASAIGSWAAGDNGNGRAAAAGQQPQVAPESVVDETARQAGGVTRLALRRSCCRASRRRRGWRPILRGGDGNGLSARGCPAGNSRGAFRRAPGGVALAEHLEPQVIVAVSPGSPAPPPAAAGGKTSGKARKSLKEERKPARPNRRRRRTSRNGRLLPTTSTTKRKSRRFRRTAILALNRGERARVLRVRIEGDIEAMHKAIDELFVPAGASPRRFPPRLCPRCVGAAWSFPAWSAKSAAS